MLTGGTLLDKLNEKLLISEKKVSRIIRQILSGIAYCHAIKIIHRDIKPENIMFEDNSINSYAKLVDFGFATIYDQKKIFKELMGSPLYMAPEVVVGEGANEKSDIWSLGIILHILLSGTVPYKLTNINHLFQQIKIIKFDAQHFSSNIWKHVSEAGKDLLSLMLNSDPEKRPGAEQLLKHRWLLNENVSNLLKEDDFKQILARVMDFKAKYSLQHAVFHFLSNNFLLKTQINNIQKMFLVLDKSGDGRLSKEEMKIGLEQFKRTSISDKEMDELFKRMDADNNGFIDYGEFLSAAINEEVLKSEELIQISFNFFDKDGDGKITIEELKEIFKGDYGENNESIEALIVEIDKNHDKMISYNEFRDMILKFTIHSKK